MKKLILSATTLSVFTFLNILTAVNVSAQIRPQDRRITLGAIADLPLRGDIVSSLVNNSNNQIRPDTTGSVVLPNVRIKQVSYAGSGCPQGSSNVTLSPDKDAVSILFDNYISEAGLEVNKGESRNDCNMRISIDAPAGYRMVVAQIDYRGFFSLPSGGRASFYSSHQLLQPTVLRALAPRVLSTQRFSGEDSNEYILSARIEDRAFVRNLPVVNNVLRPVLRPIQPLLQVCGGPVVLDVQTRTFVQTNRAGDSSLLTVDSADAQIANGMNFRLLWKACGNPEI